jgi:CDP-diacylglycerol--glycerol-3-phosphate 3-phosphatidyltransferase
VTDAWAVGLVGASAVAGTAYAIRAAVRGRVAPDRLSRVGPGLLGRPFLEAAYFLVTPLQRALLRLGVTPDQSTWASLVAGLGGGIALAGGRLGLAALLATVSAFLDILDGELARATGRGSPAGEVLDAAVDRYTELFLCGGAVLYYRHELALAVVALAALGASFLVSYSTAKAEAMGVDPPSVPMRRHERAAFLIAGAAFSPLFPAPLRLAGVEVHAVPLALALAAIALVGNAAALRRFQLTHRRLGSR